ncbi:MAG TPA: ProQ/FINO family protein [Burkholderiaceae bacterium]|jgi:ProP effector|nr:ProQ/FINO family protein [Burkholderiaceae bacterium]
MNAPSTAVPVSPAHAVLKTLKEHFPVFRNSNPLAIGIDKQIVALMPELNRRDLRAALGMHTKSTPYLKQIARLNDRFDLDGKVVSAVTDAQRLHAAAILKDRASKGAELRAAKLEAERQAKRDAEQAEAAKKQAEKLGQLLSKFSRNSK